MGTELLLNYWIHGDKVEIGPNCLSHDYLCPMTIWGLIKRSQCLPDWSKNSEEERLAELRDDCFYLHLSAEFILLSPLRSSPLSYKMCVFKNGWRSLLQGRSPASGARIRALLFSRIVWGCQWRTPPPRARAGVHTPTHTHTRLTCQ